MAESKSKKKVLALTRYSRMGASSRLRTFQYLPYLERNGSHFEVEPLFDDMYLNRIYSGKKKSVLKVLRYYSNRAKKLFSTGNYDMIWIEYELFPFLFSYAEQWLGKRGIPVIVDYDDAVFHYYDMHKSRAVRLLLNDKIDKVMANASAVVVGNSYLQKRAAQAGAKLIVNLPTVVDLERYQRKTGRSSSSVIIGWIGSPSTIPFLEEIMPGLERLAEECDIKLHVVGGTLSKSYNLPVEEIEWSEETETSEVSKFDIGIMPIPNNPWAKGKCGYKLIQYMACGLPVVCSPVGANLSIVENDQSGFFAEGLHEWKNKLCQLCASAELRDTFGKRGREIVEEKYQLKKTEPVLLDLFNSLLNHN